MKIQKVHVDGQTFILRPGQDASHLRQQILEAARNGAGFVTFKTVGRATIRVLITPQVGVRFETVRLRKAQLDEWEHHPPSIDAAVMEYDDLL